MTLDEIEAKEKKTNESFEKWINDSRAFLLLPFSQRDLLKDYVAGLAREIGDLESDKLRLKQELMNIRHNNTEC